MYSAIIILCILIFIRELSFVGERKQWSNERKDLYSRIQAGSLQEYEQHIKEPTGTVVKSREQKAAEEAEAKGIPVSDLRYPASWKS